MIYGSSNAQSALGSLLRKMQEETMTNPAKTPVSAEGSSPIRQQIQGPIDSPEAIGSEKVVAMKPEMAMSQETPSPIAPTNMPVDAAGGASPAAPVSPLNTPNVVAPTIVAPTPTISSGIRSPISTSTTYPLSNSPAAPETSKSSTTSLATNSLLPSQIKNLNVGTKISAPQKSTQTNRSIAEAPQTFQGVNAGQNTFDKIMDAFFKLMPGNFTQKLLPSLFKYTAADKLKSNKA